MDKTKKKTESEFSREKKIKKECEILKIDQSSVYIYIYTYTKPQKETNIESH